MSGMKVVVVAFLTSVIFAPAEAKKSGPKVIVRAAKLGSATDTELTTDSFKKF